MDYEHIKSDGDSIHCYGEIHEDANYFVSCSDENHDEDLCGIDCKHSTWPMVCEYIIKQMRRMHPGCDIQQIEAG